MISSSLSGALTTKMTALFLSWSSFRYRLQLVSSSRIASGGLGTLLTSALYCFTPAHAEDGWIGERSASRCSLKRSRVRGGSLVERASSSEKSLSLSRLWRVGSAGSRRCEKLASSPNSAAAPKVESPSPLTRLSMLRSSGSGCFASSMTRTCDARAHSETENALFHFPWLEDGHTRAPQARLG